MILSTCGSSGGCGGKGIFEVNPSGSLERGRGGGRIVVTVGHDRMILRVECDGGKKVLN
jgi:hypothetical protein